MSNTGRASCGVNGTLTYRTRGSSVCTRPELFIRRSKLRLVRLHVLQLVTRVVQPDARLEEPAGPFDRQFDAGDDVQAPAGCADVAVEIHEFAVESVVETEHPVGPETGHPDLGEPLVGFVCRCDGLVDRLVVLEQRQH